MSFLRRLWKTLTGCFRKKLNPADPLARYILSKRHFSRQNNRVKGAAFMPPENLRLSVFRIKGLNEDDMWAIGEAYVAKPSKKTLYGRGDVTVSAVRQIELDLDADNEPPRHADIVGWPEEKSAQKLLAEELAVDATLRLNSSRI